MRSGITRQALRHHRWTMAGPFATQTVAATTISVMLMTMRSLDRAPLTAAQRATPQFLTMADATAVFFGVSVYMAMLVVGVTMALAMTSQLRDIALLRTVGATPGQIRRSAALQAAVVAVPASVVGVVLAVPAGAGWTALLRAHDVLPQQVVFRPDLAVGPVALGVVLATSVVGTLIAAVRTSRQRPGAAMVEVATGRRSVGKTRTVVGLGLVVGGAVLSAVLSRFSPEQAGDAAFFVMLAGCVGVGLLGPHLLRAAVHLLRPTSGEGVVRVALDDIGSMSRALSAALVPLVLAAAFAIVKVGTHSTAEHVTGVPDLAVDQWTDYSGTTVYCAFAAVAALNCFVTVLVGRRRDLAAMQLAGATRRTVVQIVAVEAGVVTAVTVVVAAVVATITTAPMLHTSLGVWFPYIPPTVVAGGVVVVAAVVAVGMVVPAAVLTRRPPTEHALAA